MRKSISSVIFACGLFLPCSSLFAQSSGASICVAPIVAEKPKTCAPGLCDAGPISFKLDDRDIQAWPNVESLKIDGLDATAKHRVTVYRAGKAQQSFSFRYPVMGYKYPGNRSNNACLFLDSMYWEVQLWPIEDAPWCRCK
jgi:hypothetical protein